jgi:hypothetical protein
MRPLRLIVPEGEVHGGSVLRNVRMHGRRRGPRVHLVEHLRRSHACVARAVDARLERGLVLGRGAFGLLDLRWTGHHDAIAGAGPFHGAGHANVLMEEPIFDAYRELGAISLRNLEAEGGTGLTARR